MDSIHQTIIFPVWFNVRVRMRRVLGNQSDLQQSTQFLKPTCMVKLTLSTVHTMPFGPLATVLAFDNGRAKYPVRCYVPEPHYTVNVLKFRSLGKCS